MRYAIAIILVAAAVAAAVVLGSLHLGPHLQFISMGGLGGHNRGTGVVRIDERADWQVPVAIVIGVLGIGAAVAIVARDPRRRVEIAAS